MVHSRPLKHMKLRQKLIVEKDWLQKIHRTRPEKQLRKLIQEATPHQLRVIQNLIIAHFDPKQNIPIDQNTYRALKRSKKLKMIAKYFSPTKTLNAIHECKAILLKIIPVLKLFVSNAVK